MFFKKYPKSISLVVILAIFVVMLHRLTPPEIRQMIVEPEVFLACICCAIIGFIGTCNTAYRHMLFANHVMSLLPEQPDTVIEKLSTLFLGYFLPVFLPSSYLAFACYSISVTKVEQLANGGFAVAGLILGLVSMALTAHLCTLKTMIDLESSISTCEQAKRAFHDIDDELM